MSETYEFEYEIGSKNIFADLGLEDADELIVRAKLGAQILWILQERGLKKQKDVQEALGISQAEASKLMNARFNRFSESRLFNFLNKLDQKVTIQISPRHANELPQEVVLIG